MTPSEDINDVLAITSSNLNENSYSYITDRKTLGVAVIDRFTHFTVKFLRDMPNITFSQLMELYEKESLLSTVSLKSSWADNYIKSRIQDFFTANYPKNN